jgi:hypothetical protein
VVRDADRAPAPERRPQQAAPAAAPKPAVQAPPSRREPSTVSQAGLPDLHQVIERWDDLVARMRAAGKSVAATALEHASPTALTARGDVTIALDESNPIYEQALEASKSDVAAMLGEWFPAVQRIVVRAAEAGGPPPARLTDEMVRSERLATLRKKDPVLDAAIDALDLDLAD